MFLWHLQFLTENISHLYSVFVLFYLIIAIYPFREYFCHAGYVTPILKSLFALPFQADILHKMSLQ